jgi:hypothetical protein
MAAVDRYQREEEEVEQLLAARDSAYLQLLAVPSAAGAARPCVQMRLRAFVSPAAYSAVTERLQGRLHGKVTGEGLLTSIPDTAVPWLGLCTANI